MISKIISLDYFRFDNLADEWRRKNVRRVIFQALTAIVLLTVLCTPMLWSFAPLIDLIGVDGLLLLLDINVMIGLALLFGPALAPVRKWLLQTGAVMSQRQAWLLFAQRGWKE
jgi:hypothetical protein